MLEGVSEILQPYKDTVGSVASIVTILQFFSGAFICYDIYKDKHTKNISAMPFIGAIIIGMLVLKYAILLQDKNMFNVNVAAIVLNSIYLMFYMKYCSEITNNVIKPAAKGLAIFTVVMLYAQYEKAEALEFRYGLIVTVLMLMLLGSPLIEASEMIESKDASSIPLPLTFMGFIVSILWFLYGIILLNYFMIIQNLLGVLLCSLQLVLIFKYPGPNSQTAGRSHIE